MKEMTFPTIQPESKEEKLPWCKPAIRKLTTIDTIFEVGAVTDGEGSTGTSLV